MASSNKEDGTVEAAEQLALLSIGDSAKRKSEPETTEDEKNGAVTRTELCSECGKKSDTLKKCNGCKCVWYCDKKCQNKHRKEHKKECRRIMKELDQRGGKLALGSELDVGPLGKVPPREDCSICMRVLPLHDGLQGYYACCGKIICGGCFFRHEIKCGKQVDGGQTCAFCRVPNTRVDEEIFARLSKRVELEDPQGICNMAGVYGAGRLGLSVDQPKCIDLLRQSSDLGCPSAQYELGSYHKSGRMGLQQNAEEAFKYWERAAEGGHVLARHNLGSVEEENGNRAAAMRHWRLSAAGGSRRSMIFLTEYFEDGLLHHCDLAETLQAMYCARAEIKSDDRDKNMENLKKNGQYFANEYDL